VSAQKGRAALALCQRPPSEGGSCSQKSSRLEDSSAWGRLGGHCAERVLSSREGLTVSASASVETPRRLRPAACLPSLRASSCAGRERGRGRGRDALVGSPPRSQHGSSPRVGLQGFIRTFIHDEYDLMILWRIFWSILRVSMISK